MLISIITPTHGTPFLGELYDALKAQRAAPPWEWVIVPNNGAEIPAAIAADPRVRVIPAPFGGASVGKFKRFAFAQAKGEILAEVDHDDLLTPDCLAALAEAFRDPKIGFAYSYAAHLGAPRPYARDHGWEYEWLDYGGQRLIVPKTFEASAGSLAYGWYAPNHVRAWRRESYTAAGGHDAAMEVGDDFDLLCRTYLKTRMRLIPKPLYIYRVTGDNTWLAKNAQVQAAVHAVYAKYIYALVEREAELRGLPMLDLGGAIGSPPGYVSIDREPPCTVQHDIETGIPFPDNSVAVVRAHDALGHIRDQQRLMSEIHRVLVDGGWLLSSTPSTDGRGAFQDPTHVSFWNENSFWYWTRPGVAKYIRNRTVRFQEFRLRTMFPSDWHKAAHISYVQAELRAVKSDAPRCHYSPWCMERSGEAI
jgi:SAM-dependent methyltransferase